MNPFLNIADISKLTGYEFESACRQFSNYAWLGNNTALCRILTKYKVYIDIRDAGISPHLIMDGFWETWLSLCLARVIQPGDTCIDIGANMGYYSILMSALSGDKGHTIAVEPNPHLCNLLRATAGINHPGFSVAETALSDKAGKLVLYIPEQSFGSASILRRTDLASVKQSKVRVNTITFDSLMEQMKMPKVDVIKMDVEGAEQLVFEGMKQAIEKNPGLKIIMEYSPFLYDNAKGFTEYLFSKFIVNRIKDVDEMQLLDESSIAELLALTDHTDLFLQRKPGQMV